MHSVKRAEIYRLKDNGTPDGKDRPIVIVSVEALNRGNSLTIVPFYSRQLEKQKDLDYCSLFCKGEGGLEKDCVAKADELSRIDKLQIDFARGRVGTFDETQMARLEKAIRWSLGLA